MSQQIEALLLSASSSTTLGKRPRYHLCLQCHEEYDILNNDKEACTWHPGTFTTRSHESDGDEVVIVMVMSAHDMFTNVR